MRWLILVLVLAGGATASAQITVVMHSGAIAATTPTTGCTTPTNASCDSTGANLLVMACNQYNAVTTVSDSKANTWHTAGSIQGAGFAGTTALYYAYDKSGGALVVGANHTFTCSGQAATVGIAFATTLGTSSVLDGTCKTGVSGTFGSGLVPTQSGDVFVTTAGSSNPASVSSVTITQSFTISDYEHNGGTTDLGLAYFIDGATTTKQPQWTGMGADDGPAIVLCAFKKGAASVATPSFSPNGGTFTATQTPSITSATSGASIVYTTDGTTPTETACSATHGTLISNGATVSVAVNETLKAIACKSGSTTSSLATSDAFVFQGSTPTLSPGSELISTPTAITASQAQSLAMCYRTDGTNPSSNGSGTCSAGSTLVSGTITVGASLTLKVIGMASGWTDSAVGSAIYTLTPIALVAHTGSIAIISAPALTSVNNSGVYQGTVTGGGSNALVGYVATIGGFINGANNLTNAIITGSSATSLSVSAVTVSETHGATATLSSPSTAINTTASSLIIVGCHDTGTTTGVVAQPSAGTWHALNDYGGVSFAGHVRLFYVYAPTTSASQTFTCTPWNTPSITVSAWSGTQISADPFDQQSGSNSTFIPGTITPSQSGELFITAFSNGNSGTTTFAVDSGFTISDHAHDGVATDGAQAYNVDPTTAAENPSWAASNGAYRTTAMAAFKGAVSRSPFVTVIF